MCEMDSTDDEEVHTDLLLGLIWRRRRRTRICRKHWVRPILQMQRQQGEHNNLLQGMRLCDHESHFSYLRMSKKTFDLLLEKVRMCNIIN